MRDIEEILITQPSLARDTHELRHDARFRLFIWRYEVNPFCGPFGFHSSIGEDSLLRLLDIVRNCLLASFISLATVKRLHKETSMPRMKILNSVEREVFDWPPIFNKVVRSPIDNAVTPRSRSINAFRSPKNDVTRRKVQNEQELIRRQPQDL